MKKKLPNIILCIIFFIGLSVLLYPSISDYWNSKTQSRAIQTYDETLLEMSEADYERFYDEAQLYNQSLKTLPAPLLNYDRINGYEDVLNISGYGIMGYITIEKIGIELPIYHGTSSGVLDVAVGHLEGSTLPIGGEGTHCVLSGHRGLPSAKLFTDLDKMKEGDVFMITVLDQILTYEVDQIKIVEPTDITDLEIVEGEDYCTLLTCTPYGINTHRLLIRGKRIETEEKRQIHITGDAYMVDKWLVSVIVAAPLLLLYILMVLLKPARKKIEDEEELS